MSNHRWPWWSFSSREYSKVLPNLVVNGQFFGLDDGKRFTAIQCSDFHLFARYQNGENIHPILIQRSALGFNLLRVWTLYNKNTIGVELLNPDYSKIPSFLSLCASYGLYVEFTAYVQPELQDPEHWLKLGDVSLESKTKPIFELMNEQDIHPINLDNFAKFPGILCSHGSSIVEPFWDYVTFHTNGSFQEQRKIGHNAMEIWSGPSLTNETSRYDDVGMWNNSSLSRQFNLAYDSAAGGALLCAGSCFHSFRGKTSRLFDSNEERVARAWVAGAKSINLDYQHDDYRHGQVEIDREVANGFLRCYRRGDSPFVDIRH